MQEIIRHLELSGLTYPQIEHVRAHLIFRTLKKGDYFSAPIKPAHEIGFIVKGIVRVFDLNQQGQEVTHYFIDEHGFTLDGNEYIQAVMTTELAVLAPDALMSGSFTGADWDKLVETIRVAAQLKKTELISPTLAGDASARYRKFMEMYPQIAGRVPLSYLASYLGITQQSLSRIRKQLTKKSNFRDED